MGAVCRDQQGMFLGASAIVVKHISDPATLEAMAIREVLSLSADLYVQNIHVASDCKVVVDDVRNGTSAAYGLVIKEMFPPPDS